MVCGVVIKCSLYFMLFYIKLIRHVSLHPIEQALENSYIPIKCTFDSIMLCNYFCLYAIIQDCNLKYTLCVARQTDSHFHVTFTNCILGHEIWIKGMNKVVRTKQSAFEGNTTIKCEARCRSHWNVIWYRCRKCQEICQLRGDVDIKLESFTMKCCVQ